MPVFVFVREREEGGAFGQRANLLFAVQPLLGISGHFLQQGQGVLERIIADEHNIEHALIRGGGGRRYTQTYTH